MIVSLLNVVHALPMRMLIDIAFSWWDIATYKSSLRGLVPNILDCDIVEGEFELQSRYYVHFRINTHRNCVNLLIHPLAMD